MGSLALSLLALALLPVSGLAKAPEAPVRVLWNSQPGDVSADGTWDARVSLLQGPGGFHPGGARPVLTLTEAASRLERRFPMVLDVPPNTFRATATFPRAGLYKVTVVGFDPRKPARSADLGAPVRIEPAKAPERSETNQTAVWTWVAVGAAALVVLLALMARRLGLPCWCVRGLRGRP